MQRKLSYLIAVCVTNLQPTESSFLKQRNYKISKIHLQPSEWSQQQQLRVTANTGNEDFDYDLAVIGGGPVGVQAALKAAYIDDGRGGKKKVCLIDAPKYSGAILDTDKKDLSIGGPTGLFSKALRETGKCIDVPMLRGMGLRDDSIWNEVINSCLQLADANAEETVRQLDNANVNVIEGFARFSGIGNRMSVQNAEAGTVTTVNARKVLIATGSRAFQPDFIPFDGKRIFDSDSINSLTFLPKSVAITGSGIIALEYAKIFSKLGADVTIIIRDEIPRRALEKIGLDKDVAACLLAEIAQSGIKVERGYQVCEFDVPQSISKSVRLTLAGSYDKSKPIKQISCDIYLAAIGRTPNTNKLGLENVGVDVDKYGNIPVGCNLSTSNPDIYAAGDVLGRPFLASTGVAQGMAAVESVFSEFTCDTSTPTVGTYDPDSIGASPFAFPVGIWTVPEASYYGLGLQQAIKSGFNAGEGVALYVESLRGCVFSPNGLLKIVYDKDSKVILGVHIVGDDACELIHYGMELVQNKATIDDILSRVFTAVTYHDLYRLAALATIDEKAARKRRAQVGSRLRSNQRRKDQAGRR